MSLNRWLTDDRLHHCEQLGQWRFECGDAGNTVIYTNCVYDMFDVLDALAKDGRITAQRDIDVGPPAA